MMDRVFFAAVTLYIVSTILHFIAVTGKGKRMAKAAWLTALLGVLFHTAYLVVRGVTAGRLPLSNQFEFACAFGWGVALLYLILHSKLKSAFLGACIMPMAFLISFYAALLPKEIGELMPALRSAWFGLHIGSAVFAYASFATAGVLAIRYLLTVRKGMGEDEAHLKTVDRLTYQLVAVGFLLLTVVILTGCVWAEQAWSVFWSWDPKETWSLITWILYAIYLHLRLRKGWRGKRIAWVTIAAFVCVIFTFVGVNGLLPGLHSYK